MFNFSHRLFQRWVNEQDFENASPEPNVDCSIRPGAGMLPPHELYKSTSAQSALLTTPAWAAAAGEKLCALGC